MEQITAGDSPVACTRPRYLDQIPPNAMAPEVLGHVQPAQSPSPAPAHRLKGPLANADADAAGARLLGQHQLICPRECPAHCHSSEQRQPPLAGRRHSSAVEHQLAVHGSIASAPNSAMT